MGRALVGPPGPFGPGPYGRPWALMGRALIGLPWALMGLPGPLWAGPLWAPWALMGRALMGPKRNFVSPGYLPHKNHTDQRTFNLVRPHVDRG